MAKEELKKEAIQYAIDYPTSYGNGYKHKDLRIAYLAGAEPREKRIAELKQQIEKMKHDVIECFGSEYNILVAKLLNKWEIKEND